MKSWRDLFNYEGKLMTFLYEMGELILVNIVFLLCCIPIVTIGASATSFYYTVMKSIRCGRGNPLQEFFSSMRRTIRKGSLLTVEIIVWFLILVLGRSWAADLNRHIETVCLVLMVISVGIVIYVFPVLSRFEMKLASVWKLAFVMCIRFLPATLLFLGCAALAGWLLVFQLPMACILVVPGLLCYAATFVMEKILLAYMPEPVDGDDAAWYYEAGRKKEKKERRERGRHEGFENT